MQYKTQEDFEDTKVAIIIPKSIKDRQQNGPKQTKNDLQNIHIKLTSNTSPTKKPGVTPENQAQYSTEWYSQNYNITLKERLYDK